MAATTAGSVRRPCIRHAAATPAWKNNFHPGFPQAGISTNIPREQEHWAAAKIAKGNSKKVYLHILMSLLFNTCLVK